MKEQETKIIKIEDYKGSNINRYRYSKNLTNPIMKRNFIINARSKADKFNVSDLFD